MATRSAIGYALPSGKIRSVYCHWDGYPSHQLPILKERYGSVRKVQALIRPGSMSSLQTSETWEPKNTRDPQPLYHSERGVGRAERVRQLGQVPGVQLPAATATHR